MCPDDSLQDSAITPAEPYPPVEPASTRLGWVGTGVMGAAMCANLLAAGYELCVHSRTKSKAQPLLDSGATWADTPASAAQNSDIVFTMLGFPTDVKSVMLEEHGLLEGCRVGSVIVDMTTSEPTLAAELAAICRPKGVELVDAPVSGGDVGAKNGTLSIMIGGNSQVVARLEPLWEVLGKTWVLQGGPGAGQHTKMVNQILIASTMLGICEALLYAQEAGLDPNTVLESVQSGAAGSWSLSNLVPRILRDDFEPGFYVEHFVKDLNIAEAEASLMGVPTSGVALAKSYYDKLLDSDRGRLGTQAIILAMAEESNLKWDS